MCRLFITPDIFSKLLALLNVSAVAPDPSLGEGSEGVSVYNPGCPEVIGKSERLERPVRWNVLFVVKDHADRLNSLDSR